MPLKYKVTAVRDLRAILKDLESQVRDPRHLRVGRDYPSMSMRPRELLGNWLLCVILADATGRNWTLSDDPTGGDGAMLDRDTGTGFLTEHVFIPPPRPDNKKPVQQQIEEAIAAKAGKGEEYSRGRTLIVFSEAEGNWFPNRVAKSVDGTHGFDAIWCLGLEGVENGEYIYWITRLEVAAYSPAWKVRINEDFIDWTITHIQ